MKYASKNEYWVDPNTGNPRYDFEEMYKDLSDPWGCEEKNSSITNRLFLELLLDENSSYNRILDLGSGKGSLSDLFYKKYLALLNARNSVNQSNPKIELNQISPFEMYGLEYSELAVDEAKKLNQNIKFQTFDLLNSTSIPYQDIDLVILSEVLWYLVSDLSTVFKKIHQCMRVDQERRSILAIHQYFPGDQKYFRNFLDGETGFDSFIKKEGLFETEDKVKFFHKNGDSVLLYKLTKL
ncbi:probable Methyltransferase [Leptospira ellinghausenii]|uniref:Probable Methyltransferase n=1 Tax=Leptospira ellinghausenii TaxID=1917822 RepID=A0A2P2D9L1_9LEPT|nr:class I SAM-dependent methyltransferase [Leptospira ellinghausenii]GBF41329.1 probable Methyltransferase [Leptospira ellinghausenii]